MSPKGAQPVVRHIAVKASECPKAKPKSTTTSECAYRFIIISSKKKQKKNGLSFDIRLGLGGNPMSVRLCWLERRPRIVGLRSSDDSRRSCREMEKHKKGGPMQIQQKEKKKEKKEGKKH